MPKANHLMTEYLGKRIDTPAHPELTASQQIFEDLRAQSRLSKQEFKMPMVPVKKTAPVGPPRRVTPPQRVIVHGK
jgi:hypothetical protein